MKGFMSTYSYAVRPFTFVTWHFLASFNILDVHSCITKPVKNATWKCNKSSKWRCNKWFQTFQNYLERKFLFVKSSDSHEVHFQVKPLQKFLLSSPGRFHKFNWNWRFDVLSLKACDDALLRSLPRSERKCLSYLDSPETQLKTRIIAVVLRATMDIPQKCSSAVAILMTVIYCFFIIVNRFLIVRLFRCARTSASLRISSYSSILAFGQPWEDGFCSYHSEELLF